VERQEYEVKLLDFIEMEFVFQDGSENEIDSNGTKVKIFAYQSDCFQHTIFSDTAIVLTVSPLEKFHD
jgi:hypothetical protein